MRKDVTDDPQAVADVLNRAEYATLALADDEGLYSVPVNFGFKDGVLYLHSGRKGRKIEALRRAAASGAPVAFSAATKLEMKTGERACQWGYKFHCVLGSGTVSIVEDPKEQLAALGVIMQKYAGSDSFPYEEKLLGITAVAAIRVVRATARLKND